jgi:hypothetical protein
LDAHIIRIMKKQQVLSHEELLVVLSENIQQIDISQIKLRIQYLLQQGYLERDASDLYK